MKRILSLSFWTCSACLWVLTAGILILRFSGGLQAVTGLNDAFPWGIWISFDLTGIALSAGGFVLAASVHLFRVRRFEPILRPTILTAFLGYSLASAAVLLDVGQPQRIWHPMIMWQHHSFMFEVAWCIMLYSLILVLEFAPILLDKLGLPRAKEAIHIFTLPIVLMGVLLSTLHQSSLGSLFLIVPEKLHAFWFSPLLPAFFLLSAIAGGMALVIVETLLARRLLSVRVDESLPSGLAGAMALVLGAYVILRAVDFHHRGAMEIFLQWKFESFLLFAEIAAGAIIPLLFLAVPGIRRSSRALFVISAAVAGGVILNRFNVSWFGLLRYSRFAYVPSWMEIVSTLGLLTAGIAVFILTARVLPVFEESGVVRK